MIQSGLPSVCYLLPVMKCGSMHVEYVSHNLLHLNALANIMLKLFNIFQVQTQSPGQPAGTK